MKHTTLGGPRHPQRSDAPALPPGIRRVTKRYPSLQMLPPVAGQVGVRTRPVVLEVEVIEIEPEFWRLQRRGGATLQEAIEAIAALDQGGPRS